MKIRFFAFLFGGLCPMLLAGQSTNPCIAGQSFRIVVLGSSTAAGVGASPKDSAWVNRYRAFWKQLNTDNELINRAQGGFTTYRIMPTDFTPPPGRPAADTTRNITYALSLQPDAIIVNLPSNDVAVGYSVAEQLSNFDSLVAVAKTGEVPIWICTTQPRNAGGNPSFIAKQKEVRDSIRARFAPRVLDFWTGMADSTGQLKPSFDSGDGVHLNNAGHRLLFQRAVAAHLPEAILDTLDAVQYALTHISPQLSTPCGDPQTPVQVQAVNVGAPDTTGIQLEVALFHMGVLVQKDSTFLQLGACSDSTLTFFFPLSERGNYRIQAALVSQQGSVLDSAQATYSVLGIPGLSPLGDTLCEPGPVWLSVAANGSDSIRWYKQELGGSPIAGGDTFPIPFLEKDTVLFAEAVRGSFHYSGSLTTTYTSNVDWNGCMFDVVADTLLIIDSLGLKIADTGWQQVEVYLHEGTHLGVESLPSEWENWTLDSVWVAHPDSPVVIQLPGVTLSPGDTLAFYLQLFDPGARLSYQNLVLPAWRSNEHLRIFTGSGSSHNFAQSFFPRDWNGTVFYHYGQKPNGDCVSERIPVEAAVQPAKVQLGPDTILNLSDSIFVGFTHDPFADYLWSNGDTLPGFWLKGSELGTGIYPLELTITTAAGCQDSDEQIVVFAPLVNTTQQRPAAIRLWPNPVTQGRLFMQLPKEWEDISAALFDVHGRLQGYQTFRFGGPHQWEVSNLPPGWYSLQIQYNQQVYRYQLLVQ